MTSGIYEILCLKEDVKYIGRTRSFGTRKYEHWYLLQAGAHHTKKLQAAWLEHGAENFEFRIVEETPIELLVRREQLHLDMYIDKPELLYNTHLRAEGLDKHTPETRALMSEIQQRPEIVAAKRLAWLGKRHTPETLKLMSDIASTPEWAAAMSAVHKGVPKSEPQKAKMSATKMGHSVSEETRAAISKTLSGRPSAPEAGAKAGKSNTGKKRTPVQIARASAWQDEPGKLDAAIAKAVETRKKNAKPNPAKGRPQTEEQKQSVARIRAEKIANGYVDPRIGRIPWNKKI